MSMCSPVSLWLDETDKGLAVAAVLYLKTSFLQRHAIQSRVLSISTPWFAALILHCDIMRMMRYMYVPIPWSYGDSTHIRRRLGDLTAPVRLAATTLGDGRKTVTPSSGLHGRSEPDRAFVGNWCNLPFETLKKKKKKEPWNVLSPPRCQRRHPLCGLGQTAIRSNFGVVPEL
jgi:hypothetical protein